jgi:hypothetical protein
VWSISVCFGLGDVIYRHHARRSSLGFSGIVDETHASEADRDGSASRFIGRGVRRRGLAGPHRNLSRRMLSVAAAPSSSLGRRVSRRARVDEPFNSLRRSRQARLG